MEIDLNSPLSDLEREECDKEAGCDKVEGGGSVYCCLSASNSSCSSNAASNTTSPCSLSAPSSIYNELWHACAGPLANLPKKGNMVMYFAQGHMEQSASALSFPPLEFLAFDLPPQIFCRVVDVHLLANKENDDVYTQLTLLPLSEPVCVESEGKDNENGGVDEDGNVVGLAKATSHMFCKTLTASDTSTHGGFSVPRRAAEDCFPPLDYKEQRPSQELIAVDLHGVEWKFRHIYRGQPRRHLLTTGWSIFVSQKNLVSGDAVLFLRGESGELRLGIRRASRPRNGLPDSINKNQSSCPNVLSPVANALSSNTTFCVFYSPRASHADFMIPYQKYVKCAAGQIPVGTRFKMRFDLDDSPERRFSGVVTGVCDMDPYRWPNSKWRSLMVCWDDDIANNHQDRISPWDVDLSGNFLPLSIQSSPRIKKLRPTPQFNPRGNPFVGAGARLGFEESLGSSKVLQGQENTTSTSPLYRSDGNGHQLFLETQPLAPNPIANRMDTFNRMEFLKNPVPSSFTGFLQSNWFPEVLQGQEICSLRSLSGKNKINLGAWSKAELGCNGFSAYPRSQPSYYPLASEGVRSMAFPRKGIYQAAPGPIMISDFQTGSRVLNMTSMLSGDKVDMGRVRQLANEPKRIEKTSVATTSKMYLENTNNDSNLKPKSPCKLFGFSLTEDHASVSSGKRSCTKVHKQGSLVGRAIDLSRFQGYFDLLIELERLFNMEGLLRDPKDGWHVLYTDNENDMMVVGDDPWNEFTEVVTKIHIYTHEEVKKLSIGMNSDDTESCLEEAPPIMSKASSVAWPDSSLTAVRM